MKNLTNLLFVFITLLTTQCHSESMAQGNEIKAEKIIKLINSGENILIQNATIINPLNFTHISNKNIESPGIERAFIDVSITFINCTFTNKVSSIDKKNNLISLCEFSKNLSFVNCVFNKEVDFSQSIIVGNSNFNQSKFNKEAIFNGVSFRASNNYFIETSFSNKALFTNIHVLGNINLMKSEFKQNFSLQNCLVIGKTLIGATNFGAYADFSSSHFMDMLDCKYAKFEGNSIFSFSTFNGKLKLADAQFIGDLIISKATFYEKLQIDNTIFSKNSVISNSFFLKQESSELVSIQSILKANTYFNNL